MRALLAAVACALVAGCATTYQPMAFSGGYSETALAENVFKVSFAGNGYIGADTVSDYALLRSAEVTIENGFRYFIITDERSYSTNSTFTTPTTTNAYVTGYGNSAYGTATTYGGQTYNVSKPSSSNLIVCFKDKPEGFAFDAEFVSKSLKRKYGLNEIQQQVQGPTPPPSAGSRP
jgi:hypothetical protein